MKSANVGTIVLSDGAVFVAKPNRCVSKVNASCKAYKCAGCVITIGIGTNSISGTSFDERTCCRVFYIVFRGGKNRSVLCTVNEFEVPTYSCTKEQSVSPGIAVNCRKTNHFSGKHLVFFVFVIRPLDETFLYLSVDS